MMMGEVQTIMSAFFLTFDFGTESLRGALFNEKGDMLNTASHTYQTLFPRPGWSEQIPDEWWEAGMQSHTTAQLIGVSTSGT